MRRLVPTMLAATLLAAWTAPAQDVARTEPANGAKAVPVDVGVIRIHFDTDMRGDSYSVLVSKKGPFPPLAGDNTKPWKSARVFELRVGPLEPGTTYALQINSTGRQGFQSSAGKATKPTLVTFTTAAAAPPADQTIGGQPVAVPPPPAPTFDVERIATHEWTSSGPQGLDARATTRRIAFREVVLRTESGRIVESRRVVREATATTAGEKETLCPPGSAYRVRFDAERSTVTADDGKAPSAAVAGALAQPLRPDLLPEATLVKGQRWSYRDADLTRRARFLGAAGGTLDLAVDDVIDDPAAKCRVAVVTGRLETTLRVDGTPLAFDATVAIRVGVDDGVPRVIEVAGPLRNRVDRDDDSAAVITGRARFVQRVATDGKAIAPSATLADAVDEAAPSTDDAAWGYSQKNPILLKGGPDAVHAYLKTLCDTKGRGFRYRQKDTQGVALLTFVLVDEDKGRHTLYVKHTGEKEPKDVPAPKGMQKGPGRSIRLSW